jgi:hypothetical protein
MKPTIQFNEKSDRDFDDRDFRRGSALPQTDYSYHGTLTGNMSGRCYSSRRPSFRSISQDYFENEARPTFAAEAALFSVIAMTAAVPIFNSASALLHLVRSFATL